MRRRLALALGLLGLTTACASAPVRTDAWGLTGRWDDGFLPESQRRPAPRLVASAKAGRDGFDALLSASGIEQAAVPSCGPLGPAGAVRLLKALLATPTTLDNFGPRMVATYLFREVIQGGVDVPRGVSLERLARFRRMVVLRPDGYLAGAITGRTVQRAGRLEFKGGVWKAEPYELGRFYKNTGSVFRAVDEQLEVRDWTPLTEVYDDGDVINRALDGAQDVVVELAVALGRLIVHPLQSLEELSQMPAGVVALIRNSPAYFARFRRMTKGEQIQALARLTTTVLLTYGTAAGGTVRISSAAEGLESVSMPVLALSADGTMALETVAVPVGKAAQALSGGPGAITALHMANDAVRGAGEGSTAVPVEPGHWVEDTSSMSERARKYQAQVTGAPEGRAYRVEKVEPYEGKSYVDFDGYKDGVLIEAKGPGYESFFPEGGTPEDWFGGAKDMLEQAKRQRDAANGIPIRWYVAEERVATAIRALFVRNNLKIIEVIFVPPAP